LPPGGLDRLPGQRHGVGSHVGDVAVLIQRLRHPHRLAGPRRSLREASCCREEVVKGAAGRRVYGLDSSLVTSAGASVRASTRVAADSWVTTVADFAR